MAKKRTIETGTSLEARVQRLFACQGAFAERGLFIRAVKGSSRLVTDLDIVAHDYSINFHHSRIYAECKGGKNVPTLDRVVWILGVAKVIGAESAYLVLDHCNADSVAFACTSGVDIIQASGLLALETTLKIDKDFWPGRTNLRAYEPVEQRIEVELREKETSKASAWLRGASELWREASALAFSYGRLNTLLGLMQAARGLVEEGAVQSERMTLFQYATACLLVRLSQYALFGAADTVGMAKTEREQYLSERLTTGNLEIDQARKMLGLALQLARTKLEEEGSSAPAGWQVDHLLSPPAYTEAFTRLVERVMEDGHRARFLPLAMELRLFGFSGNERGSAGLINRVKYAFELTGAVKAFAIQALGVPEALTRGPVEEAQAVCSIQAEAPAEKSTKDAGQLFDKPCG